MLIAIRVHHIAMYQLTKGRCGSRKGRIGFLPILVSPREDLDAHEVTHASSHTAQAQ
jgi:hypothetical protein